MKRLSTALLAVGLVSLAACGGKGANNAATANNAVEALPPVDGNVADLNSLPPADLNVSNAAANAAASNTATTNSTGNTH
jgi:hypothetical protein